MIPSLSRGLRAALVLALSMGYVAWHTHAAFAKSKGGDGDDSSDDGDDSSDDDGGGGKDDTGDGDDDEDAKDQPAVTSGGLFTMNTYPVREISRPLTLTQHITQLRLGLGTDLSAKGAFGTFGVNLEAGYGYSDNFMLIGGMTDAYNFKQFGFYVGFEGSIVYDLLDIRLAANVHRSALPSYSTFCNPPAMPGEMITAGHPACGNMGASQDVLPDGNFSAGGTQFSIDLGFPFRYAIKPEVAIVALQTLMSIDFNAVAVDHVNVLPVANAMPGQPAVMTVITGNSAKPDLKPSIGIATNPVPPLPVVIYAQLKIPDFDTAAGAFQVPLTGRVEFSPSQKFDIGLEFTLLNVKPPQGQSPIDNRFLSLFMQARY